MRQHEINQAKNNLKAMQKALTLVEIYQAMATEVSDSIKSNLLPSTISEGTLDTTQDFMDSFERTAYEYARAIEYYQSRIRTLQALDREDKYGVRGSIKKTPKAAKVKKTPEKVAFVQLAKDGYQVLVGDRLIGTIRKSKSKYVSGTKKVFTPEAIATRKFVVDGELQVVDKDIVSNTRFKSWKIGNGAECFPSFEAATMELLAAKLPNVKVTL